MLRKLIASRFQLLMAIMASERRDQFFIGKLLAHGHIHLIRHVVNGRECHGLGPGQSGSLALGIKRGLAPGHQFVQALFGFPARPRGFGVQIDSIRTPIDLGHPNFHEFNEQRLLASCLER